MVRPNHQPCELNIFLKETHVAVILKILETERLVNFVGRLGLIMEEVAALEAALELTEAGAVVGAVNLLQ